MVLRKLVRSNYGRKSPVSMKYKNLLSFKEGVVLLCQSILETRMFNPFIAASGKKRQFFVYAQKHICKCSVCYDLENEKEDLVCVQWFHESCF